jgi:CheY-like chemotaxis protein
VALETLEQEGFFVEIADNGKIAVDKLTQQGSAYDLVFMDLQMPVMDGYTATKTLRQDEAFKDIPIVAMTADAMSGVEEKVLAIGMNGYVTKPINPKALWETMVKWIQPGEREVNPAYTALHDEKAPAGKEEQPFPDFLSSAGINTETGLIRSSGNRKLYEKLLVKFRESNQETIDAIRVQLESGDRETAERTAHTLKGVSGNIGADTLFEAATALDTELKKEDYDTDEAARLLEETEAALSPVLKAIGKFEAEKASAGANAAVRDSEAGTPEVDTTVLISKLEELNAKIADYDTEAGALADELKPQLTAAGIGEDAAALIKAVGSYDFDSAGELVDKITQLLKA